MPNAHGSDGSGFSRRRHDTATSHVRRPGPPRLLATGRTADYDRNTGQSGTSGGGGHHVRHCGLSARPPRLQGLGRRVKR